VIVLQPLLDVVKDYFSSTDELDGFIGLLQKFGQTQTQIVFSTPVHPWGIQND
jgi:Lrp/AsnC family leucine-responsive transcriptional regulator